MRRYITEKVGILECFQIILAMIALGLGYYALGTDVAWNHRVETQGINVCININNDVNKRNSSILLNSECNDRLDIKHEEECKTYIKEHYLTKRNPKEKTIIQYGAQKKEIKKFLHLYVTRLQASETSFLIVMSCVEVLLVIHLVLASVSNNIDLRTKWNASIQGIILFACGFSAMLLAISVNTIDNKYITASFQLQMCGVLRFCDRGVTTHPELPIDTEVIINDVLSKFDACQDVKVKQSICILLIIIIGTCCTMILLAMDLTTKYEQESEEQEVLEKEAADNLDNLIEDEAVVFENSNEAAPTVEVTSTGGTAGFHAMKSGSTVIAEYLGVRH